MRTLLIALAFAASAASVHAPDHRRRPLVGLKTALGHRGDLVAAKKVESKPPGFLSAAYAACGLATTASWWTVVRTVTEAGFEHCGSIDVKC